MERGPDYDLVNSGQSRHLQQLIRRTHVVSSNPGKINKLLNIVLSQDIFWTNSRSLKDSGWSKCPGRKNNKTWRPSHQYLSSTLCSSNCIVNIFNPYCTNTTTVIEIMNMSIFFLIKELEKTNNILKYDAHYTMPNQHLQIFIVILVINVMMSGIRSSSCFKVNIPSENNKKFNITSFICLLTWPISKREDKIRKL